MARVSKYQLTDYIDYCNEKFEQHEKKWRFDIEHRDGKFRVIETDLDGEWLCGLSAYGTKADAHDYLRTFMYGYNVRTSAN